MKNKTKFTSSTVTAITNKPVVSFDTQRTVNASIKHTDRFYLIGTTDRLRRSYTVLNVTKADYYTDGIKQTTTNITALNEDSKREIVFDLSNLIGIGAKFIEV